MAGTDRVYHLELKAFPSVARVFNLERAELDARFLKPWTEGEMIDHDERRWSPEKTKLTVYAGERVASTGRGLGRGWGEVTRHAEEVTDTVIAEIRRGADARPEVESLKTALAEVAARPGGIGFPDAVALGAAAHPGWRASEQLSLAEQAVWEMLHRGELAMDDGERGVVDRARWQEIVLSWATWAGDRDGPEVRLRSPGEPGG